MTLAGSLWGGILAAPPETFVDTAIPADSAAAPSGTDAVSGPSSTTPAGTGDHTESAGTTTTIPNTGATAPDTGEVVSAVQLEPGEAVLFAVHGDADEEVPVELDDHWSTGRRPSGSSPSTTASPAPDTATTSPSSSAQR